MSTTHNYRERRRIRKLKHVEAEMERRGCAKCRSDVFCSVEWPAAALRDAGSKIKSPVRLAHDDASFERIDRRIAETTFICQNHWYIEQADRLRERYS